jgi:hypothetical protein
MVVMGDFLAVKKEIFSATIQLDLHLSQVPLPNKKEICSLTLQEEVTAYQWQNYLLDMGVL